MSRDRRYEMPRFPLQVPARRAGQVNRDDAAYMPIPQRELENSEGLKQEIRDLKRTIAEKDAEIMRLNRLVKKAEDTLGMVDHVNRPANTDSPDYWHGYAAGFDRGIAADRT